jgi:hypothetical protein
MTRRDEAENRIGATESKFYLPARASLPLVAGWFERTWATLFSHRA